jgi:hypothetical protein
MYIKYTSSNYFVHIAYDEIILKGNPYDNTGASPYNNTIIYVIHILSAIDNAPITISSGSDEPV